MSGTDLLVLMGLAIKDNVKGFKIKFKNESTFMKFLGCLVYPFNRKFMTGYITTIGKTVYFPSKERYESDPVGCAMILAHEGVHLHDGVKLPILYELSYLFPQVLAILASLSIMSIWLGKVYLLFLLFLLFLLPLPAYFRMRLEMRGYAMSIAVSSWYYETPPTFGDHEITTFTGGDYFWSWPFKSDVVNRLGVYVNKIRDGSILKEKIYRDVYNVVMRYKADNKGVKK